MGLTLVLGSKNYSSWSLRAYLALEQTGAAFDELVIPLDQPETHTLLQEHSPSGRVPVLRDGERLVWDSLAIGEYLAERFPNAGLWPIDPGPRAIARSVCAEMHSGFAALRQHMPFNARHSAPGKGRGPGVAEDIARVTALWRECRERFGAAGPFLFGRRSLADAMYAPVVLRFCTYAVELDADADAYRKTTLALPALQRWLEAARAEPHRSAKYDL